MSLNQEEDQKRHDKFMAELWKKNKKHIDAAIASYRKPNCQTNIDRPAATDMGPGDEPEKISGKKKNERGLKKGKDESCGLCFAQLYVWWCMQKVL
ncbi:hypothetical protein TSUD_228510 [Trifolium subterraneum]|uniref:Uncharacterized protein n=1 Tax=Trifolium subterraneum TaxID=3900 RepID=A0A2Z6LR31_TRISU|nr:hypothetical protein TSUD_228510 [Trifolium subterraneum]